MHFIIVTIPSVRTVILEIRREDHLVSLLATSKGSPGDLIQDSHQGTRYETNQNGISSAVSGGFGSPWLADIVDDIWVLAGVVVSVEVETGAAMELGVGVGISEVEAVIGGGGFGVRMGGGGGLFMTCHFTRSRVAMESSTDECPTLAPPVWMVLPRCSLTLQNSESDCTAHKCRPIVERTETYKSRSALLYGGPAGCRNTIAVSTFRK